MAFWEAVKYNIHIYFYFQYVYGLDITTSLYWKEGNDEICMYASYFQLQTWQSAINKTSFGFQS